MVFCKYFDFDVEGGVKSGGRDLCVLMCVCNVEMVVVLLLFISRS